MMVRHALATFAGLALSTAVVASGCSKSSTVGLEDGCSINSDCSSPLICVFSRCHSQCSDSRDCPSGERCVASTSGGVCQLSEESSCGSGYLCETGEVCGADEQCRLGCTNSGGCVNGDYCLTSGTAGACYSATTAADLTALEMAGVLSPDGAVESDAAVVSLAADGSSPPPEGTDGSIGPDSSGPAPGSDAASQPVSDGAASSDASDASDATLPVNVCLTAQTQFGNTAQGDANPSFTSGVGVRTASSLLIFSGYSGPDPTGAGGDAGDAGPSNYVYVQAFDPATAASLGPAQPLFGAPPGSGLVVETASIAPTGQIALAFDYGGGYSYANGSGAQHDLYAAFIGAGSDAGPAGVALQKMIAVQSGTITGQSHVIWSATLGAFVFSWEYSNTSGWFIGAQNFLPGGQAAGGIDPVPTDDSSDTVHNYGYFLEQGSVAVGSTLMAMAFQSDPTLNPSISILDLNGNPVGSALHLAPFDNTHGWDTVGATVQGFAFLYANGDAVSEFFIPTAADAGAPASDAEAPGFSGFTFAGVGAVNAHAISDDPHGPGGVGVAMLYATGASFGYINADGVTHVGPLSVIAHTYTAGDEINVANFAGSFSLSVYGAQTHSTQVAASGCP